MGRVIRGCERPLAQNGVKEVETVSLSCSGAGICSRVSRRQRLQKQQIGQAEAFAGTLPLLHFPEAMRGLDFMHFVDNTSAFASFTSGTSAFDDSSAIFPWAQNC